MLSTGIWCGLAKGILKSDLATFPHHPRGPQHLFTFLSPRLLAHTQEQSYDVPQGHRRQVKPLVGLASSQDPRNVCCGSWGQRKEGE